MKQEFNNEEDLNDYLEENHGVRLDFYFRRDDSELMLTQTNNSFIVSFLSPDSDAQDFFENDDGAGSFHEFNSPEEREKYMSALSKTKKLYYLVDKYEHSGVHYSVAETKHYPDQQFDVTQGKAVILPCDDVQAQYKSYKKEHGEVEAFKHFIKDTNSVLDEYSKWCNGEVYGYQVLTFDKKGVVLDDDACWGFIGYDYALKEKQCVVEGIVEREKINSLAKEVDINTLDKSEIKTLPFKMMQKGFLEGSIARVYDDIIVSAHYEDKDVVVQWNSAMEKPSIAKYEAWQAKHNVTPEQFLDARMKSDINSAIRTHLANTQEKINQPTL